MFVDTSDIVYVAPQHLLPIQAWNSATQVLTRNITSYSNLVYSMFVTTNGDIFIDDAGSSGQVIKWTINAAQSTPVMNVSSSCYGLFVDNNDTIYCSVKSQNVVIKKSLDNNSSDSVIAAGNGSPPSAANTLSYPQGIFVDQYFTLYVADCTNNRIQSFEQGQMNGTTKFPNGSSLTLNCPTSITLDGNGYMYIVDINNNRIIGSDANGFRCVAGCISAGSSANQLLSPQTMLFDRYGNMFVLDKDSNRVQKFLLTNCSE